MAKRLQNVHVNSIPAYYGCPVVYGSVAYSSVVYSSVVDVQLKTITIYLIAYPVIHY